MENRRELVARLSARVRELDIEIKELEAIAGRTAEEVKAEYHEQIINLFLRKEELNDKVNRLQKASGDAWKDMKAGTELSWEVFNDAIKKLRNRRSIH
jgi:methionine salvage enolase-phosphatase E1